MKKDFLSIADTPYAEVGRLALRARDVKRAITERPLEGKIIAMLFEKPSLRTRLSFEIGIRRLGGECVFLSKDEVNLGSREPVEDVARVLERWVDGIVARVFRHADIQKLSACAGVPVINALSDIEHPCQAMADLLTILEHKGTLEGIRVCYVGDGNNVATSLALGCASVGADFAIAAPPGYAIPEGSWREAVARASAMGSSVTRSESPQDAVRGADVVYTDTWVSMGQEAEQAERASAFAGFQVNPELMARAKPDSVFMHDMPAYEGAEISEGMLYDPRSVVFDQAENRLHAQNAIMIDLFSQRDHG